MSIVQASTAFFTKWNPVWLKWQTELMENVCSDQMRGLLVRIRANVGEALGFSHRSKVATHACDNICGKSPSAFNAAFVEPKQH
jgi:hypothetical protein